MSAADNAPRWDGSTRGRYEVWYLTFNHRASQTGFWIRYTVESPTDPAHEPGARLWFAFFDAADPGASFGINRRFARADLDLDADRPGVAIGAARLGHDGATGAIEGDGHRARWQLAWTPAPATYHHMPPWLYRPALAPATSVLSPNLDVALRGEVEVDGRRFALDGDPGAQTHLWGRRHAREWAWGHCNAFDGATGAALELVTARVERAGRVLPSLTSLSLTVGGEQLRFNRLRDLIATRARYAPGQLAFAASSALARVEGQFRCRPEQLVVATYRDPDGDPAYCANCEVADLQLTVSRRRSRFARMREHARLTATRSGHFEVGRRQPFAGIGKPHVSI